MYRAIKSDLKRGILSYRFLFALFCMFLVWELNRRRFEIHPGEDLLYLYIHTRGRTLMSLLSLVVTAIPCTSFLCEDYENRMINYSIVRSGVNSYIIAKMITVFISAFLIMFLGSFLFLLWGNLSLPLIVENSLAVTNFGKMGCSGYLLPEYAWLYIWIQVVMDGLQCASMAVLAMAGSVFLNHSHAVLIFPFVFNYFFYYLFSRNGMPTWLSIEFIYNTSAGTYSESLVFIIGYAILITILFVVFSFSILKWRLGVRYK